MALSGLLAKESVCIKWQQTCHGDIISIPCIRVFRQTHWRYHQCISKGPIVHSWLWCVQLVWKQNPQHVATSQHTTKQHQRQNVLKPEFLRLTGHPPNNPASQMFLVNDSPPANVSQVEQPPPTSYFGLYKHNNSLRMVLLAPITSLSTRWFSSTEAPLGRMLHQRKLARLHAFIAYEPRGAGLSSSPTNAAVGLGSGRLGVLISL